MGEGRGGRRTGPGARSGEHRRLAAIMFSDMVGYTAMTQSNERLTLETLDEHRRLVRPILAAHNGREVKTIGDAFLVEFDSALEAVDCAIQVQQAVARSNEGLTSLKRILIRIGIHVGDIIEKDGDVYGDTVNIASRIEKLADAGGIAISGQVYAQVEKKIQFPISKMGEFQLKNVESPVPVYAVSPVWRSVRAEAREPSRRRIAVLPLKNIGGDQEDEYLADGLTEELITSLSNLPSLKVIARSSVMRFKNSGKSISEVGRELGAGYILEGSLRRSGEELRTSVQLVEVETEELLWSRRYSKELRGALSIQQDIAEETAVSLMSKIGEDRSPTSRKSITGNGDAFILYLKGRYKLTRHSKSEVEAAITLFERAIELDPAFASAYAMLAQCYLFLGFFGHLPQREAFEKAQPHLRRAIEVDEDLDTAHMLMGRLLMDRDWDWSAAEAELRKAIELSPNSAEAHYRYALLLHDLARNEEAETELQAAEELDPLSVAVNQVAGTVLYYVGKNSEAVERFQRALEIEPRAALAHNNLGLAYLEQGKPDAALAEIGKALELDPDSFFFRTDLCYVYSRLGMQADARRVLSEARAASSARQVPSVALAGMFACLGEHDEALRMLEDAYSDHSAYLSSLKVERWFDALRPDPRFVSLLQRVGLG